jgi:hypothetical protein
MAKTRFRVKDKVSVEIEDLNVSVRGVVKKIEEDPDDDADLCEVRFLVQYDVPIDGRTEGLHAVHELRLIHGEDDTRPEQKEEQKRVDDLPTYKDFRIKVEARMNTAFDALYCKEETKEKWTHHVTVKGQWLLHLQLCSMSLLDIAQLYGELPESVT